MKKSLVILLILSTSFTFAQQITFADILNAEPEVKLNTSKRPNEKQAKRPVYKSYTHSPLKSLNRTFFESYLSVVGNVGAISGSSYSNNGYSSGTNLPPIGLGLEYEFGARFAPIFFVGAGIGARTYFPSNQNNFGNIANWGFNLPLFASAKIYMCSNYNFSLSADFGLGGCLAIQKTNTTPSGMYLKVGIGADIKRLTIAAGYEMMAKISSGTLGHFGYLKIGVILAK